MRATFLFGTWTGGLVILVVWVGIGAWREHRPAAPRTAGRPGLAPVGSTLRVGNGAEAAAEGGVPEVGRFGSTARGREAEIVPGLRPEVAAALAAEAERVTRRRLPRDGLDLLVDGPPEVAALAQILDEAGVGVETLRANLAVVHGHVLRLEQFGRFALDDLQRLGAAEEARQAGQELPGPPVEALRRQAEVWPATVTEYEAYVRRDLAFHVGLTNEAPFRAILARVRPPEPRAGAGPE